jgi:hypothetical protein
MNTAEKIYQGVQGFSEPLALEVLHFVEFLTVKNQFSIDLQLEQKIQQGISQADSDLGITLNDDYIDNLNQRVQQRLAVARDT